MSFAKRCTPFKGDEGVFFIVGVRVFHARDWRKVFVRAIVEGDLFRSAHSSFFLSSFFSHPESCLKILFFMRKNDVFGGAREGTRRET